MFFKQYLFILKFYNIYNILILYYLNYICNFPNIHNNYENFPINLKKTNIIKHHEII